MGFFAYLILGLIAGSIAKLILSKDHGWFATLLLGVIGAMVGGSLGNWIFDTGVDQFWSLSSWVLAIVGSVIVISIYGALTGNKSKN